MLELFSGTGSVSKQCVLQPHIFEVTSLDICDKLHPVDLKVDVMQWEYQEFTPDSFDFIWASPPCTQYSIARTTGGPRDIENANKVVQRVLDIIKYFKPVVAIIENPASGALKYQPMMQNLKSHVVHYCRYAPEWGYKKSTQLWILGSKGLPHFRGKLCIKGDRCEGFTVRHPNTFSNNRNQIPLKDKYRIPNVLIDEILDQVKEQVLLHRDEVAMIL